MIAKEIDKIEIEQLSVKSFRAYKLGRITFGEEFLEREGDFIHEYNIDRMRDLVFNCGRLEDRDYVMGLVHSRTGGGYVSFQLKDSRFKRITLFLKHNDYDNSYYEFRMDNRAGKLELSNDIEYIKEMVEDFLRL